MAVRPEDLATTLLRRHRRQQERARARAGSLRESVREEVASLGSAAEISRAWLIGSLARGGFGERSDVDLVVEGLPPREVGPVSARLAERLGISVDLLRLETLPDGFRARVLEEGIPLDVA